MRCYAGEDEYPAADGASYPEGDQVEEGHVSHWRFGVLLGGLLYVQSIVFVGLVGDGTYNGQGRISRGGVGRIVGEMGLLPCQVEGFACQCVG